MNGGLKGWARTFFIPYKQKGAARGVAELDAGGRIPVGQLPESNVVIHASSFPSDVSDGDLVYRTDLGETFQYNAAHQVWLGLALIGPFFAFSPAGTGGAAFLNFEIGTFTGSATVGETIPVDVMCVGMSLLIIGAPGAGLVSVNAAGSTTEAGLNYAAGNSRDSFWGPVGSVISAESNISFETSAAIGVCRVAAWFKRAIAA